MCIVIKFKTLDFSTEQEKTHARTDNGIIAPFLAAL